MRCLPGSVVVWLFAGRRLHSEGSRAQQVIAASSPSLGHLLDKQRDAERDERDPGQSLGTLGDTFAKARAESVAELKRR